MPAAHVIGPLVVVVAAAPDSTVLIVPFGVVWSTPLNDTASATSPITPLSPLIEIVLFRPGVGAMSRKSAVPREGFEFDAIDAPND